MSKNFSQFDNSAISQFVNEIAISMDLNQMQAFNLYILNHYYTHRKKVEDIGVEPMTLCVQGRCSSQLS